VNLLTTPLTDTYDVASVVVWESLMSSRLAGYARRASPEALTRLVAAIPKQEVERLDAWGIAAGMPSRTAAIRFLLDKGLEAVGTTATEQAS
jgi:hypothetical protein